MTRKDAELRRAGQATRPEETFAQSGREELSKRAEAFLDWRDAVLTNEDIEAIHKMRVASRRLRATMDAYKPACRTKYFKQVYRTVKKAAYLLGAARDTDVMVQHVEGLMKIAPGEEQVGMRWFVEQLTSYRAACQHAIEGFLVSLDETAFQETVTSCLPKAVSKDKAKAKPGLNIHAPTGYGARSIARVKLEELYRWRDAVDRPYAVRELHQLRIAAKRFRYTLEIFEPFLPEGCTSVVKELEQVQEELGQLHDSDVMIALLRLCLGNLEYPLASQIIAVEEAPRAKPRPFVPTALVLSLLNPKRAPTAEQRYGLEQLVRQQQYQREEGFSTFHQHWSHLQERDIRLNLLALLEEELTVR
ncbi:MAG TPA: CHAD domain-containing protein [Ktedonobacteraceae bacterium]|nr:CHAD domain-containing protein [Ktedonobacteraceae bacterium]